MTHAAHIQRARTQIKRWRDDPVAFVTECLKVPEIDQWQLEALRVFPSQDDDKRRLSLQACVGPGKTAVLSWLGWNFLTCYRTRDSHPKGAAVSVTHTNLKDNLWPELSKWQTRSELLTSQFEWTKERIYAKEHPETWFLSARSYSKSANEEEQGRTLSGLHSDCVLVLVDESGDIPVPVIKAGEQALSSCMWGKIVQAGNPTSHHGILYAAATVLRHLWYIIRITSDPDDPKRTPRVDAEWAREQIRTYGRDNPWVMSSILGTFPPGSLNSLLSVDEVEQAMLRNPPHDQYAYSQKRIGVDVARFGDDRTILFPRQGLMAHKPVEMRGARSNEIAARVAMAKRKWGSELEFIDDTGGFGSGVIDSLHQARLAPQAINFAGKAIDNRYFNKRSEMWFEMAEWVKRGGAIPNLPELSRELTAPTYTFQGGKLRLEEKDQIKSRLGYSPDLADALALTFALPDMPATRVVGGITLPNKQPSYDFDPYDSSRM